MNDIVLDDGVARVTIHPALGGSVGRYDWRRGDTLTPIFETTRDAGRTGAFALGCQVMVPFANRIAGGGFSHEGRFHPLVPNWSGEPYPNHGNGFESIWIMEANSPTSVALSLRSDGPGPFRYDARLDYALQDGALSLRLAVTNRAGMNLPYGAGFHPWFVRTADARLQFVAGGCWSEQPDYLPDRHMTLDQASAFDFRAGRPLPAQWINVAFTDWDGRAELRWPERGLAVTLTAEEPLTTLMVYSPSGDAKTICIEPVSHSVDAHNRRDLGTAPPQILAPGESLIITTTISPHTI